MDNTKLVYYQTNENLESIVQGLQPNKQDTILAIGGSGDQAFALLENAKAVHCIDWNETQARYISERAECLKEEKYQEFFHPYLELKQIRSCERDQYFKDHTRIKKIKANLKNLKIEHADLFKLAKKKGYTKIYLSNALCYETKYSLKLALETDIIGCFKRTMYEISRPLPPNGLIYVTDHEYLCKVLDISNINPIVTRYGAITISNPKKLLPEDLAIDSELTSLARAYESASDEWYPAVYRKIR